MFKSKAKKTQEFVESRLPEKTPEQIEVEKAVARSARLESLSKEAVMWRKFAGDCKPGRYLREDIHSYFKPFGSEKLPETLLVYMDADTALLWKEFAGRMADDRERRLKDMLS